MTTAQSSPSPSLLLSRLRSERKRKIVVPQQHSPPTAFLRFEVSDFEDLSHPKGSFVETRSVRTSPQSDRSWQLRVYPRGHQRSRSDKVLVSCFLTSGTAEPSAANASADGTVDNSDGDGDNGNDNDNDNDKHFEFSFRIKDWRMVPRRCELKTNLAYGFMGHTRETILERGLDRDGTLVVDVALTFWSADRPSNAATAAMRHPYGRAKKRRIRKPSLAEDLMRSPEFADLAFCVDRHRAVVRAHSCVLAVRARPLLELALLDGDRDENNEANELVGKLQPVQLPDVEEGIFRAFLDYVYTSNRERLLSFVVAGKETKTETDAGVALTLLVEADKFGAIDLKTELESILVDRFLSLSNCCEMLLFADSHWCALLKEAATNVFCSDPTAATTTTTTEGSRGWKMLRESPKLLSELVLRCTRTKLKTMVTTILDNNSGSKNSTSLGFHGNRHRPRPEDLPVIQLRDLLEEAGLNADGSKEMLVRRFARL